MVPYQALTYLTHFVPRIFSKSDFWIFFAIWSQISSISSHRPHSVHPPRLSAGGGGLSLLPNFQKGGLAGPPFLEGGCWKRGGYFFQGRGCNFSAKNKLKSGMFNDKRSL